MSGWMPLVAGVGAAVAGGFYVAFSAAVMPALCRRAPAEASATMATINDCAERAPFLTVFFGTAVASVAVLVGSATDPQPPLRMAGAALYLAGVVSTIAVNVPLNRRLAGADSAEAWQRVERPWTRANHVRAALSILGAVALLTPGP